MYSVDLRTRDGHGYAIVGDLLLASPRPEVLRVLTVTRLIDIFPVHASVDEAAGHARWRAAARAGRPGLTVAT